jgi:hypothetical protein
LRDHGPIDLAIWGRPPTRFRAKRGGSRITLTFVAPLHHRLARRPGLTLADLEGGDFIFREDGSGSRELVEGVITAAGMKPAIAMTVAHRGFLPLLPLHARLKAFILAEGGVVVAEMEAAQAERPRPRVVGRGSSAVTR